MLSNERVFIQAVRSATRGGLKGPREALEQLGDARQTHGNEGEKRGAIEVWKRQNKNSHVKTDELDFKAETLPVCPPAPAERDGSVSSC